jgi:hypothetical protein
MMRFIRYRNLRKQALACNFLKLKRIALIGCDKPNTGQSSVNPDGEVCAKYSHWAEVL